MSAYPVTPDLVANLPVLHPVRFRMAVARPQRPVLGARRSITVLHPRRRFIRRRAMPFDVHRDRRLRAGVAREPDELVRSKVAGLELVAPRQIDPRRPRVTRA